MSEAVQQFLTLARRTALENWRFCKVCMVRTEHRPYTSPSTQAHGWRKLLLDYVVLLCYNNRNLVYKRRL